VIEISVVEAAEFAVVRYRYFKQRASPFRAKPVQIGPENVVIPGICAKNER